MPQVSLFKKQAYSTIILYIQTDPYMQAALDHLRNEGETINEEDEGRLSPLRHSHINMLGHYTFTLAEQVTKGQLRPLKQAEETDEWPL